MDGPFIILELAVGPCFVSNVGKSNTIWCLGTISIATINIRNTKALDLDYSMNYCYVFIFTWSLSNENTSRVPIHHLPTRLIREMKGRWDCVPPYWHIRQTELIKSLCFILSCDLKISPHYPRCTLHYTKKLSRYISYMKEPCVPHSLLFLQCVRVNALWQWRKHAT